MSEAEDLTSRERYNAKRKERRARRRRLFLGIPLILVGLAMIGAGAYVWFDSGDSGDDPVVAGTTQVQTTTTTIALDLGE